MADSFPPPEVLKKIVACGTGRAEVLKAGASYDEIAAEAASICATHVIIGHKCDAAECLKLKACLVKTQAELTKGRFLTAVLCEKKHPKEADYIPVR